MEQGDQSQSYSYEQEESQDQSGLNISYSQYGEEYQAYYQAVAAAKSRRRGGVRGGAKTDTKESRRREKHDKLLHARYERYRKGVGGSDLTPWVSVDGVQKGVEKGVAQAKDLADDVRAGFSYLWDEVVFKGM